MKVNVEFHEHHESRTDALSGKQGEVYVVTFSDGTITESPLSLKSIAQLLKMKLAQKSKIDPKPEPRPTIPMAMAGNGPQK